SDDFRKRQQMAFLVALSRYDQFSSDPQPVPKSCPQRSVQASVWLEQRDRRAQSTSVDERRSEIATRTLTRKLPRCAEGPADQAWPRDGNASLSPLREEIPSFMNTFRRCHSTVRTLRNSSAPISAFECPSLARRAMCSSCGVRSFRDAGSRLRTFS